MMLLLIFAVNLALGACAGDTAFHELCIFIIYITYNALHCIEDGVQGRKKEL